MPEFSLDISERSVKVRLVESQRTRFYAFIFFIVVTVLVMFGLLFLPGKHGNPSMWRDLSASPVDSGSFVVDLVILSLVPILIFLTSRRYVVSAYPSDETFYCDRSTLTISRAQWFDFHNRHWDTRSYALVEVVGIRYGVVARLQSASIYGLHFISGGRKERVLPGLNSHDADTILNALKSIGADVQLPSAQMKP
jgi:hypothetical protein